MQQRATIDFVLVHKARTWADIEQLDESEIQRDPRRFVGGRNSWIAQTYLRMRGPLEANGWRVRCVDRFDPGNIAVVHRDDANRWNAAAHASFLVVVRADRAPVEACDLSVVQNSLSLAPRERFVPFWPQPGLLPRNPARAARIERLAYHGRNGTSPPWFWEASFAEDLRRRGVAFEPERHRWEDYRDVDLAIAARVDACTRLRTKPAAKVYNAWLAGVPMLATPDPAFCELRRHPLDFIQVESARDVLHAVDLLRANPRLYQAMVANGATRAREYGVGAARRHWLDFFESEVAPAFATRRHAARGRRLWYLGALLRQKAASRLHRLRIARELRWAV